MRAHTAQHAPGRGAVLWVTQVRLQGLFDDGRRQCFVAGAGIKLWNRQQGRNVLHIRGVSQLLAQRLDRGFDTVEGHQNLQHKTVGLA